MWRHKRPKEPMIKHKLQLSRASIQIGGQRSFSSRFYVREMESEVTLNFVDGGLS
jgi:hypothetical protein